MKDRGKRQMNPSTADEDDMDDREITESLTGALRAVSESPGAPNYAAELKKRDEERKLMYESETGRTITLDLLAKGVDPGPGRVLHILPDPADLVEEPLNEDIFSKDSDNLGDLGIDEHTLDELPDDDPEFQNFMNAFKASMGNDNFETMLEALGNKLGENTNELGLSDESVNPFNDFEEKDDLLEKRKSTAEELLSASQRELVDLDNMEVLQSPVKPLNFEEGLSQLKTKGHPKDEPKKTNSFDFDSMDLGDPNLLKPTNLVDKRQKNYLLALLDNEPIPEEPETNSSYPLTSVVRDAEGIIPQSEIDRQWNFILFARCPEPDYSKPLSERRKENMTRATGLYRDMIEKNVKPDVETLTAYMSVYSEAAKLSESLDILDKFAADHDLLPNENTYLYLIRMHIYLKDIDGALQRFQEMKDRELAPTGKIYGTLIQSLTHRDKLVEALQLLEEAHKLDIHISNTYIKKLRNRCENLGVTHPYIPDDPNQWAKDVKEFRKKAKGKPIGSRVHAARSMSFA